jgi:transketolase C-terminal domain/subunit
MRCDLDGKLVEAAAAHDGLVYLRTMRQDTDVIYDGEETFEIGGRKVLRRSAGIGSRLSERAQRCTRP